MSNREDSIGTRQNSKAESAAKIPKETPTQDAQQADTTDDDATSVTGGTFVVDPDERVTGAESMIEADLDNPRVHER